MSATLPNFFLAGAPKAGTTSLTRYLGQHPEIFVSAIKEPHFFASEIRAARFAAAEHRTAAGIISERGAYEALFRDAGSAKAVGDASVCYLWSATAAANIAATIPQARILLVLRDPADRAFSQYVQGVAKKYIHCDLRDHISASLKETDGLFRITYPFLQLGEYASQIRRFQQHFPAAQIHIRLYEDFQRDPHVFLHEVFEFLGVDSGFAPNFSQRAHVYAERESLTLSAADRRWLVEYYREGILELQELVGRDLSAWLRWE